jgi:hypothetical protein
VLDAVLSETLPASTIVLPQRTSSSDNGRLLPIEAVQTKALMLADTILSPRTTAVSLPSTVKLSETPPTGTAGTILPAGSQSCRSLPLDVVPVSTFGRCRTMIAVSTTTTVAISTACELPSRTASMTPRSVHTLCPTSVPEAALTE